MCSCFGYIDGFYRLDSLIRLLQSLIKSKFSSIFLILLICLIEFIFLLGFPQIFQVSEGREGVVVNAILETGNYILPLRHAELIPSKPPLFHWIATLIVELTSKFDEFELRLTSVLAATALVIYYYFFCLKYFEKSFALFSCLLLLTNYGFVRMATDARVDMLFYFLSTVAILLWIKSYYQAVFETKDLSLFPKRTYSIIALLIGFSILTKGPLGAVLPLVVISANLIYFHGLSGLKILVNYRWIYLLIIALPWYLLAAFSGKAAFVERQLIFENILRFVGAEGITIKPWWFYLQHYWIQAAPWSFALFLLICKKLWRLFKLRILQKEGTLQFPSNNKFADFIMNASTIWAVVVFVFLSLAAGKRSAYLLLISVPLNIVVSIYLYRLRLTLHLFAEGKEMLAKRIYKICLFVWSLVLIVPLIFVFISVTGIYSMLPGEKLALVFKAIVIAVKDWEKILLLYYLSFLVLGLLSFFVAYKKKDHLLFVCSGFIFLIYFFSFLLNTGMAIKGVTHGYKSFAEDVATIVPAAEKLTFIKKKRDESFDGFFFYFKKNVFLFEPSGLEDAASSPQENGWYLSRKMWLDEQPENFFNRVEIVKIGGRMVDTEEKKVVLFKLLN